MKKTIKNIELNRINGFWVEGVAVSEEGGKLEFSRPFRAIIDASATYTYLSDGNINILFERVKTEGGKLFEVVGTGRVGDFYGDMREEPLYIIPQLCLGKIYFTEAAAAILEDSTMDCIIDRSILHQCVLTLDSKLNIVTFIFQGNREKGKQNLGEFDTLFQYVELMFDCRPKRALSEAKRRLLMFADRTGEIKCEITQLEISDSTCDRLVEEGYLKYEEGVYSITDVGRRASIGV